jgi:hypothetical protein
MMVHVARGHLNHSPTLTNKQIPLYLRISLANVYFWFIYLAFASNSEIDII